MLRIGLGNRLDPALAGQGIDAGEAPVDPLGKLAGGLTRCRPPPPPGQETAAPR